MKYKPGDIILNTMHNSIHIIIHFYYDQFPAWEYYSYLPKDKLGSNFFWANNDDHIKVICE